MTSTHGTPGVHSFYTLENPKAHTHLSYSNGEPRGLAYSCLPSKKWGCLAWEWWGFGRHWAVDTVTKSCVPFHEGL